jgi:two-component system OmpR family response regulator
MRIVYIDDDELLLQVAQVVLEASGCEVTCVNDPRRAAETVFAMDPEIVLLDVMMPERDGLQTLGDLQRAGAVDRAPVIFVTGDAEPEDRRRLIGAGAAGVIAKPFAPQTLWEDMRRIQQEWRLRTGSQPSDPPRTLARAMGK